MLWFFFMTSSISEYSFARFPPALRWLGWGHRRAAAPPDPPFLWGNRRLCTRPRSRLTVWWDEQMETISKKSEKQNSTTTYKSFCLTRVSKQMRIVFPSTVTEMFLSSLKSTLSSPNMSLSAADRSRLTVNLEHPVMFYIAVNRYSTQCLDLSVTHCSMTPSLVWKTSMSMTVDWHSITGDGNKPDESTTGRQALCTSMFTDWPFWAFGFDWTSSTTVVTASAYMSFRGLAIHCSRTHRETEEDKESTRDREILQWALTAHLQHHHARFMDQGDVFEDL